MDENEVREQVKKHGHPIVDGKRATFYWCGPSAPRLMGDFSNWAQGPTAQLSSRGDGVWSVTLEFRLDTYMEYAFLQDGERMADPLNPRTTPDGLGHHNHYFYMPTGGPTPLAATPGGFPRGRVTRYELPTKGYITGKKRAVHLYQPPVEAPAPLWVVWDGPDYLRRGSLVNMVDNLIAAGRIQPVALAMLQNGGVSRPIEYMCGELTVEYLPDVLLPFARNELNLLDIKDHPGAYGVMGVSMGGLMALYAGMRLPGIFGRILSQSGAFSFDEFDPVVVPLVEHGPRQPLKIWMDAGIYEWLLEPNRRMFQLLKERGYNVVYHEFSAGHNYPAWRDELPAGLEHLLNP